MKQNSEHAVSPVVGVMLMLVVTIIIAAVVSGFAGGLIKGQAKAPQATIQGKFSVTSGLQIIHAGGDAIPTSGIEISTTCGPTFGSNLELMTANVVNLSTVTNSAGTPVLYINPTTGMPDGYNITSFNPGDTLYVSIANCAPAILQPTVVALGGGSVYAFDGTHWTYSGQKGQYWGLNFVNPNNVGKQFYLDVHDKASGALISRSVVTITG
ncbi:MAG TPA: type IV pilin N-terminal domain-containing protein [Methanoregulaceae archaeon]|nr:type IV pilin N-terminal domain-containing protein [Methanoregulaceae archaeon]